MNNVMRHEYKVLTEQDKLDMKNIKDLGLAFYEGIERLEDRIDGRSRELSLAKTKIEEAVLWCGKHITRPE
jgi:hypothetical protein